MIDLAKKIAEDKGMDFVYYVLEGLGTFNCDLEHEIETALDNDDVKWALLKEYCLPENADYKYAKEMALKDLKYCITASNPALEYFKKVVEDYSGGRSVNAEKVAMKILENNALWEEIYEFIEEQL